MKSKPKLSDYIRKHWLLVGIFVCIFFASIYPHLGATEGPLKPEYTVKYGAVSIIFFISGLSLKADSISYTFQQHQLHLYIQTFTFILIPVIMQLLNILLNLLGVKQWILKGLIATACMPPPVSSAVILTRAAQGNETAAIFNSVLGSFLGVIVTPILLYFNIGFTTIVPVSGTILQLIVGVLVPIILGQIIRRCTEFRGHTLPLSSISQCALLFIMYSTFCDTFETPNVGLNAPDILVVMVLVLLLQMGLLLLSFSCARFLKFTPPDVICAMFCATHKSLTLGISILSILFKGMIRWSHIRLPLLIYHPTQMILGGLLISYLKEWVNFQSVKKPPV